MMSNAYTGQRVLAAAGLLFLTMFSFPCYAAQKAAELRAGAEQSYQEKQYLDAAQGFEKAAEAEQEESAVRITGVEPGSKNKRIVNDLAKAGYLYAYVLRQYDRAMTLYQKSLALARRAGLKAEVVVCAREVARGHRFLGNADEAVKYFTEALAAAQQQRLDADAADLHNEMGLLLFDLTRYDDALNHYNESLVINRRLGQARENEAANNINNIGRVYLWQGQYETALKRFEDALSLHQKLGRGSEAAMNFNNIGLTYHRQGRYGKAIASFEKALEGFRKFNETVEVANALRNIGDVHLALGQYENAMKKYEDALTINKTTGDEAQTAELLASIGWLHYLLTRYDKALPYYEQALNINKKLKRGIFAADNASTIGLIYSYGKGQHDKALKSLEEALSTARKLNLGPSEAAYLNNMGQVYFSIGRYDDAARVFRNAYELYQKAGDSGMIVVLYNLGRALYVKNDHPGAIQAFLGSVGLIENVRKSSSGTARRDYVAKLIASYQFLASSYIRQGDFNSAVHALEQSRAKFLAEQLAGSDEGLVVPSARDIQNGISDDTAVLMYGNVNLRDKAVMVVTRKEVYGLEFHNMLFYDPKWSKNHESVTAAITNARGVRIVERDAKLNTVELKPGCSCDAIINYYRTLLANSGGELRGVLVKERTGASKDDEIRELARLLYDLLIKPVEDRLKGRKELIIVTDGALGFLPFETLLDTNNRYLAETCQVRYVQSMGVMDLLTKRRFKEDRKPLLSFGGAVYDQASYNSTMARGRSAPARNVSSDPLMPRWTNLPGTLKEVRAISAMVPGARMVVGESVTKRHVQKLSANGELSGYKAVHFATHGMVVPAMPERSAVVLSQLDKDRDEDDGYLRMADISALKFRADFVNLSGCETGLGKLYEGEGVVGLTHAFLVAGANGLSVSLWQVADESTSTFMTGVYELASARGWSYVQAIAEMKRRFIRGDYGTAYRAPYYWAPFVYYGR